MKYSLTLLLSLILGISNSIAQESKTYVHHTDANNSSYNETRLSSQMFDFNSNFILMVTHNHNPPGSKALVWDKKVGLYYSGGYWRIYNQDKSPMDTGLNFNIFIPGTDVKAWVHTADSENIVGNWTPIDHPLLNGDSSAVFFISDVWNPNGKINGIYNTFTNGVFYNSVIQKWCIFNQKQADKMPIGSSFSIILPEKSSNIVRYVHRAVKANIQANATLIDHPDANDNPNAEIFITQNWNPNKGKGKYNNNNVGVFYNGSRWAIYTENLSDMDTGISFNVMIYSKKTSSIKTQNMQSQVHIFPNPVHNGTELEVQINNSIQGEFTIEINDLCGKTLNSKTVTKTDDNFSDKLMIEDLKKGIYYLNIYSQGFVSIQKFVIE